MKFTTEGEAFLGRKLEREKREGIDHYAIGQHLAEREGAKEGGMSIARLSWVGPLGAVSMAVVKLDGGDWEPALKKIRVVGLSYDYGIRTLPPDFELTPEMKAALARLEEEEG